MNKITVLIVCSVLLCSCGKKENEEPASETPSVTDTLKKSEVTTKSPEKQDTKKQNPVELKPEKTISALEAKDNVGKVVIVKGFVADVYQSDRVAYLNFVEKYPRNPFTAVIFPRSFEEFGNLYEYMGKNVAVTGIITTYKDKPQIILYNKSQVKVLE
jgi:DNA/RNA endonuclease YhcR with UshA esterase domain